MGDWLMTKAQALDEWRGRILPAVKHYYEQDGKPDYPARREAWNNWTDGLCKDGEITQRQCETWLHPRGCG